jgi:hypothetical protein
MRKPRVPEGCQAFDETLCVVQAALHRHWKGSWRHREFPFEPPRQTLRDGTPTAFEQ